MHVKGDKLRYEHLWNFMLSIKNDRVNLHAQMWEDKQSMLLDKIKLQKMSGMRYPVYLEHVNSGHRHTVMHGITYELW